MDELEQPELEPETEPAPVATRTPELVGKFVVYDGSLLRYASEQVHDTYDDALAELEQLHAESGHDFSVEPI